MATATMTLLVSISTRGRYDTTLPLAIQSVIMQTYKPDKLAIFDDNDTPVDLRNNQLYRYLFQMLNEKGIAWEVIYGEKKGQHHNHQRANSMGYDWVWRLDDDTVAEPTTLQRLMERTEGAGAVGGSVLTPPVPKPVAVTGSIDKVYSEPNVQWSYVDREQEVDHLHCSFLYRAGVHDYDLTLSKVAHREETLFTYGLKKKGYRVLVIPNAVTWHLRNPSGGIRDGREELFKHDEQIFQREVFQLKDTTVIVLDNGIGDHIVFKHVLPEIKNPMIFSCYPEIVPGRSIAEAQAMFGNVDRFNVYLWMDKHSWKDSLQSAFRKMYVNDHNRTVCSTTA